MGLKLFPTTEEISSPTVTALYVPDPWDWNSLDMALRARGVCFGGSYGKIAQKVFRIGHMGTQADLKLLAGALDILEQVLATKQRT